MTTEKAVARDHRGFGKRIKYLLSENKFAAGSDFFRLLTKAYNGMLSLAPYGLKYGAGSALRRAKYPYCVLQPDDFVIQLGAPRDTLIAGRSRAVHFARIVKDGLTVVIEPDPANCAVFKKFIRRHGLESRVRLIEVGAWNAPGQLEFLSSDSHPAANVLASAKDIGEDVMKKRGYREIRVPVDTLGNILKENGIHGAPRLVSITTNGAEKQILEGMEDWLGGREVPYISLALTGGGYPEIMKAMGYELLALDDRGYTFRRIQTA